MAADVDVRQVIGDPSYCLRDGAGRGRLLADLTGLVTGLAGPVQIWAGPELPPTGTGSGAAADFRRQLAAAARGRQSVLIAQPARTATASPAGEASRHVRLPDGSCARVLALTGWPPAVRPGWVQPLAALAEAVSVHVQPVPAAAAGRLLRRRLTSLVSSHAVEAHSGRLTDPGRDLAAEAARTLREGVARGSTSLVHAQVLLALRAPNPTELDRLTAQLTQDARGVSAELSGLAYQQGPAWQAAQRGGPALRWPWRLLDAASLAATLPLPVGPGRTAAHGVLAGVDPSSGVPVSVDRFGAHNSTRLVVGTSGAGKSYAAKVELARQLAAGVHAVVVDPEGEFADLATALRGLRLTVGEEPAGLDPMGLACRPSLSAAEGLSVLTSWSTALLGAPLGPVDLAVLDRALTVLRADRLAAPTTTDLLSVIDDLAGHPPFHGVDLAARLAPAAGGALGELFAPNPDLADPPPLVAFDLRAVPERARPAVMSCVLTWAWSQALVGGLEQRRLVVIDEAHLLLDDPAAAQLLVQFARRARKYGVGLELLTQRLSDFLGHATGEAILANAATKLILGCEDHERAAVARGLTLTPAEAALLRPGARGRGLLLTPGLRTAIQVVAAPAEHVLASAGPR